ncbi:cbb3-type cytochrome oxidase assembly protein CcoS [Gilvimarinus polysaccharolyticus]|uniref:cbb3-type cytochrome oxidase assembly protein CcoS n=1 Tax=Gilvimarinus polysaccharolyticus TaxID=863921 RepID=UPI000673C4A3|nr:cbb3-type cytochrome oxidase assembly protein CcoS [Gilvimarinus polysaccharolyticus]
MNILYLLIPIALVFVAIAVRVLFWAINSGQYDNLDTEAHRILFDSDEPADSADTLKHSPSAGAKPAVVSGPNNNPSESDND